MKFKECVMRAKGLQFPDYAKEQVYLTRFFTEIQKSKKKYIKLLIFKIKVNIDEVELLDEYKEKLLAMRIEIIKLKAENQKLKSELDFLRIQQEGVSDVK